MSSCSFKPCLGLTEGIVRASGAGGRRGSLFYQFHRSPVPLILGPLVALSIDNYNLGQEFGSCDLNVKCPS